MHVGEWTEKKETLIAPLEFRHWLQDIKKKKSPVRQKTDLLNVSLFPCEKKTGGKMRMCVSNSLKDRICR